LPVAEHALKGQYAPFTETLIKDPGLLGLSQRGLLMGRIKTTMVKRLTNDLVKHHGEKLGSDFSKNKEKVAELLDGASKKMRNVIAGYATRLKKAKPE